MADHLTFTSAVRSQRCSEESDRGCSIYDVGLVFSWYRQVVDVLLVFNFCQELDGGYFEVVASEHFMYEQG